KNGFRYVTLKRIKTKHPLPQDQRIALCHYHPLIRSYLFWPKNTPTSRKYSMPILNYYASNNNNNNNIEQQQQQQQQELQELQCIGLHTHTDSNGNSGSNYCYVVPTYNYDDAEKEIHDLEIDFNIKLQEIQNNPMKFVRELKEKEEDCIELNKLRKRNIELHKRLDNRRRTIKQLKSVLRVSATMQSSQSSLSKQKLQSQHQHAITAIIPKEHELQQQQQQSEQQHHEHAVTAAASKEQIIANTKEQTTQHNQHQLQHHSVRTSTDELTTRQQQQQQNTAATTDQQKQQSQPESKPASQQQQHEESYQAYQQYNMNQLQPQQHQQLMPHPLQLQNQHHNPHFFQAQVLPPATQEMIVDGITNTNTNTNNDNGEINHQVLQPMIPMMQYNNTTLNQHFPDSLNIDQFHHLQQNPHDDNNANANTNNNTNNNNIDHHQHPDPINQQNGDHSPPGPQHHHQQPVPTSINALSSPPQLHQQQHQQQHQQHHQQQQNTMVAIAGQNVGVGVEGSYTPNNYGRQFMESALGFKDDQAPPPPDEDDDEDNPHEQLHHHIQDYIEQHQQQQGVVGVTVDRGMLEVERNDNDNKGIPHDLVDAMTGNNGAETAGNVAGDHDDPCVGVGDGVSNEFIGDDYHNDDDYYYAVDEEDDDLDLDDDDCSDTEQFRQSQIELGIGGGGYGGSNRNSNPSQYYQQRPRKWPRKPVNISVQPTSNPIEEEAMNNSNNDKMGTKTTKRRRSTTPTASIKMKNNKRVNTTKSTTTTTAATTTQKGEIVKTITSKKPKTSRTTKKTGDDNSNSNKKGIQYVCSVRIQL
ncbi:MAG: hypothetical protein ACI90V_008606, partial [Bacillariaceae sp.]